MFVVSHKVVSKAEGRVEQTDDHLEVILREARRSGGARDELVIAQPSTASSAAARASTSSQALAARRWVVTCPATRTPRPPRVREAFAAASAATTR